MHKVLKSDQFAQHSVMRCREHAAATPTSVILSGS